jgi:HPt (histidine-containing phosphotransfer) domain-containing protein
LPPGSFLYLQGVGALGGGNSFKISDLRVSRVTRSGLNIVPECMASSKNFNQKEQFVHQSPFMSTFLNENSGGPQAPAFDPTRLAILMEMEEEGDTTMIKDIAAQFLEDITAVMARIEAAIDAGDFSQIASAAHTIKGSAATFGLYRMEKIAKQLEAAAKGGANNEIPAIHASLDEAFAEGRTALNGYFEDR